VELGAHPLQNEIEALARLSRITLRVPAPISRRGPAPGVLASLTARELEILAFLVAGVRPDAGLVWSGSGTLAGRGAADHVPSRGGGTDPHYSSRRHDI